MMTRETGRVSIFAATLAIALATAASSVMASNGACGPRISTREQLLECVTVEGVRTHQAAFQAIADANAGMRAAGTPGFNASADYAEQVLRAAGLVVTTQDFPFQTFISLSPSVLEQVAPVPGPVANNILSYSGSGDVTAPVSTLPVITGCNPGDWAGFPAGNIALISRGAACTFALKATNAYAAGATGVIIYNDVPGILNGTLGSNFVLDIGVTSVTQTVGQQLAATPGLVMRLKTDTFRGLASTRNVVAETPKGDPNHVVIAGAHLDSVNAGPGINDNGSGAAALLEIAVQMAKVETLNRVRFALFSAWESGLVGSTYYVNNLSQAERDRISLYLDAHMIGSPNHVFFILDGDDSDGVDAGPGPAGSAGIEKTFERYFAMAGQPFKGTDFNGLSDYGPFIAVGIPSGGLFSGATGIKTAEEAALWGGTAGEQYDPCYHLACDTFDNVNLIALDVNSDALAYAILQYAVIATETVPSLSHTTLLLALLILGATGLVALRRLRARLEPGTSQ